MKNIFWGYRHFEFVELKTMIVKDASFERVIKGLGAGGGWGRGRRVGSEL